MNIALFINFLAYFWALCCWNDTSGLPRDRPVCHSSGVLFLRGTRSMIPLFPHLHINPSRSIWTRTGLNVGAGWDLLHACSRDAPSSQEDVGSRMWAASAGRRSLFITPIPDETLVLIQGLHVTDGFFPSRREFHCLGVSCSSFTHGQPEAHNGLQGLEENM